MAPLFLRLISSPPQSIKIFVELDFFTNILVVFLLLFQLFSAEHEVSDTEEKCYFGFDSGKNINFKLSGEDFFMISISKMMVPLYFPCFLQYVGKCGRVLVTY